MKLDNMSSVCGVKIAKEWIHVSVDSFVPIDLNGGAAYEGKPCVYVNPADDSVWMCILEKAIAKLRGTTCS